MKKFTAILLAFVTVFALAACSKEAFTPKRGETENDTYTNKSFGITFAGDENWYFASEDEIAAAVGIAVEDMFTEEYAAAVENVQVIYDLYATNTVIGGRANVNFENLGENGALLSEEAYLDIAKGQLESQTALEIAAAEITSVTFGEKEIPALYVEIKVGEATVYESILVKKIENWICAVTLAAQTPEDLEEILSRVSFE